MSSNTIRVGMIGTNGHVNEVLDGIPLLQDVVFAACAVDDSVDNLQVFRSHPSFTAETIVHTDYREMLDTEDMDVVGICMPYYRNAEAAREVARRGIHVVCEKPVATSLDDLDLLRTEVEQSSVRFTAMFPMRLMPVFQAAKEVVGQGIIGEPILATGQKSYRWGTRPDWYRQRETYGGTIPWVAIHAIDFIKYTTGQEFTCVSALHSNMAHGDYAGCEDNGAILLGMTNGGHALVNFDYLRPKQAPTHGDDRLRIAGSDGVVEVKDLATRVEVVTHDRGPTDWDLEPARQFFVDFVAELRGEGQHVISPTDPFRVTEIALQARAAADRSVIIDL